MNHQKLEEVGKIPLVASYSASTKHYKTGLLSCC